MAVIVVCFFCKAGLLPADITNVTLEIRATGVNWAFPATIQMSIDTPTGTTWQYWLASWGIDEQGGPVFSQAADHDATFYHGGKVVGFPLPLSFAWPSTYYPDDYSSFLALKQNAQGWCRKWMCISINARSFGGELQNWYYQIRYFSGDPFSNQPPSLQIGRIPSGNYLKDEDLPPDSPVRFQHSGLELRKLEFIQSIQDWSNSIPLIQNKKTYVRAHFFNNGTSDVPLNNVTMRCFYNDGARWTKWPNELSDAEKTSLTVKANTAANGQTSRFNWKESLNFELNYEMTTKPLMIQLRGAGLDCEPAAFADFHKVDDLKYNFVLCSFSTPTGDKIAPTKDQVRSILPKLRAMYPLPDNPQVINAPKLRFMGLSRNPLDTPDCNNSSTYDGSCNDWRQIKSRIQDMALCVSTTSDIWYGFVGKDIDLDPFWKTLCGPQLDACKRFDDGRSADIPGCVAAGFLSPQDLRVDTLAHEVGHMLGRPHTTLNGFFGSCTELSIWPWAPFEVFPYYYINPQVPPDGLMWPFLGPFQSGSFPPDLSDAGLITALDTTKTPPFLLPLERGGEIMSYIDICAREHNKWKYYLWLSKQNYLRVYENIKSRQSASANLQIAARAAPAAAAASVPVLIISGVIDLSGTNSFLLPLQSTMLPSSPPVPDPGDYSIQFADGAGGVLQTVAFSVPFPTVEYPETNYTAQSFALALPAVQGAREIRLLRQSQVIARVVASAHSPTVQVISPNGGEILDGESLLFRWSGSDADGDPLTYRIELSSDGGATWDIVTSGHPTNSLSIPRSYLSGTTQAVLRVSVSDGFNTDSATSASVFTIQNNRPDVTIESPTENAVFETNQTMLLRASAIDPEDGYVYGGNIAWFSSINGPLGTGDELLIPSGRLSVGSHSISAIATDNGGVSQTNIVHITITVPCTYALGATNRSVPASGGTFDVAITAPPGCFWAVTNSVPWIDVLSGGGGTLGSGGVTLGVQPNTNGVSRDGSLLIAGIPFSVTQRAALLPSGYPTSWVYRSTILVSNSTDGAAKIIRDPAGDVIVVGFTDDEEHGPDMLTIKYSGATGSVLWQKRYNGPGNGTDYARGVAVDSSGNVFVTGESGGETSIDYYTVKYAAADGALIWEKRYNGPASRDDRPVAIAVDGTGDVVVTGWSQRDSGFGFNSDFYTAKYSGTNGSLLWEQRYNGPANGEDRARAMAIDNAGNVIVTGDSGTTGYGDGYTAKYASTTGQLVWEQRRTNSNVTASIAVDSNGNVIVTGITPPGHIYIAKYAALNGAALWERIYSQPNYGTAVVVDGRDDVILTGPSRNNNGDNDYYTAKYAGADGGLLWESRYDGWGQREDNPAALAVDQNGDVTVTGTSMVDAGDHYDYECLTIKYSSVNGVSISGRYYHGPVDSYDFGVAVIADGDGNLVVAGTSDDDLFTIKYASTNFMVLWENRYNGLVMTASSAAAIAVDRVGSVIVTGTTSSKTDYYTAKYSADGRLLWEQQYNGLQNSYDRATAVAVDANGDVIVTGQSVQDTRSFEDYYTAKYAAEDGRLLWERGLGFGKHASPVAVVVDKNGDVIVTGSYYDPRSFAFNYNYATVKYQSTNGAVLWVQVYDDPLNQDDYASAVAVDAEGNAIVTGRSGNYFHTVKYAGTNGARLWEQRYNGAGNGTAVCVDPAGNVVVTGTVQNDYYTAKYAATNGALLWERRYNGPANRDDIARSVATDSRGNVVVGGSSHNGTNYDYYVAKYAAANGAVLWERRYNGPANRDDQAWKVAVDSGGNVVVTGQSDSSTNSDFYTAKYASETGAVLWEKRQSGGARDLALGPDGMVAVVGGSVDPRGNNIITTVVYHEDLPAVAIERLPAGVRLRFNGFPHGTYNIERATALAGPWKILSRQVAPVYGAIEFIDVDVAPVTAYYRIRGR